MRLGGGIVTENKRYIDPLGARERARFIERRVRRNRNSPDPTKRHEHSIYLGWNQSAERRSGAAKRFFTWCFVAVCFSLSMIALVLLLSGCLPPLEATVSPVQRFSDTPGTSTPYEVTKSLTIVPVDTEYHEPLPTKTTCTVRTGYNVGTVYVRSGPGMSYRVVDVAHEGDQLVTIGPVMKGWQSVTTPGGVDGWFYVERWCK
jgi:hypothetical protein